MSRSEYRERQRKTDLSASQACGVGDGEDSSSAFGFSFGSIQSAPALGRQGLGPTEIEGGDGGGGRGRGGAKRGGNGSGARGVTGSGTGSGTGSDRGQSFTAFDNINPFEGGVKIETTAGGGGSGVLSPLSTVTGGDQSGKFAADPESQSLSDGAGGGQEGVNSHRSFAKASTCWLYYLCLSGNHALKQPSLTPQKNLQRFLRKTFGGAAQGKKKKRPLKKPFGGVELHREKERRSICSGSCLLRTSIAEQ